jgi:hypothetical protein
MQPAAPVAGLLDFLGSFGDFLTKLPAAALQIIGSPVTVAAEIAQRAGICDGCAGMWQSVLDSIGAWSVEYAYNAIMDYATNPRTWVTLAAVAATCIGTAGAGCVATATAAITQASMDLSEKVARDIEARARREVETRIMTLEEKYRERARGEGRQIIDAAAEDAKAKTRAAAGDLLYALAPRALLDLLERGGADADRIVSASVAPLAELARRVAPLDPAAAQATVSEARVSARGAIMTAVRASIRNGQPVETTVRAALEPTLARYGERLVADANIGAGRAISDLGGNLQNLSLAWDPRQVRAALVAYYAAADRSPGDPRRVAATAPVWQVATTARALPGAPLAAYTSIREARINAIANAAPLLAIRTALRGRDRVSPDRPYPYADNAIRRYIETKAGTVRPVMLDSRNSTAAAIAAALAPGMAAALDVAVPAPRGTDVPVVREIDATRPDFARQLTDRLASGRVEEAEPGRVELAENPPFAGIPWGKVAIGLGALGLGYALTR